MAFDPDLYLKEQIAKGDVSAKKAGFDPDAYLGSESTKGTPIYADVPTVAGAKPNIIRYEKAPEAKPVTMMDRIKTLYEVPTALAAPIVTEPMSMLYGVGRAAYDAATTGEKNPNAANQYYEQARQNISYQPSSPESQAILGTIGEGLQAAKVPMYMPMIGKIPSAAQTVSAVRPMAQEAMQTVKPTVNKMANALRGQVTVEAAPPMSGVGAAVVPEAVTRAEMAQQLRVPIKLSKGQATRDLGQQQFEAETMKTYPEDVGRPLIQAQELRNAQVGQNLDAYIDAIGSKVANEFYLRPTAEVVDSALTKTAQKAKANYKKAYEVARASEEGQQLVDVTPVINQLSNMEAEALNAPVINSAKLKLEKLAPDGKITLNNLEEVRKMVGDLSQDSPTQMKFGGDIKRMIDFEAEKAGGDLFKEARRLRTKYANEFENVGLIDDLLSKKPNSKDRVVAMEKVFNRSILQSDLDSLKALGLTLKKAGPEGQQAWKELQGQTIAHLKDSITKGIQTDSLGQRTFNPKQFDVIVRDLDKSGKLDYMFGKSGAQEIRNLRDTVININSPVQGINTSNTASAMDKVLSKILKKTVGKVPFGGAMVEAGAEAIEKKNIAKKVEKSLEFKAEDMANELRKGK